MEYRAAAAVAATLAPISSLLLASTAGTSRGECLSACGEGRKASGNVRERQEGWAYATSHQGTSHHGAQLSKEPAARRTTGALQVARASTGGWVLGVERHATGQRTWLPYLAWSQYMWRTPPRKG